MAVIFDLGTFCVTALRRTFCIKLLIREAISGRNEKTAIYLI